MKNYKKKLINTFKYKYVLIICGDYNVRIGNNPNTKIVEQFGEQHINENGRFTVHNKLKICTSFLRKKDMHKLIDNFRANDKMCKQIQDIHVSRGADVYSAHYIVITKIVLSARWKIETTPIT